MGDGLFLTCLTLAMIILLGLINKAPLEMLLALSLLGCFAGFFLGMKGALWIQNLLPLLPKHLSHVLTTALVTELLGWLTHFIVRNGKAGASVSR